MTATTQAAEFSEQRLELAGWPVRIMSYRVGRIYYTTVDNVSPGATIARSQGATKSEAESLALEQATTRLARTIRH
jgi:hypothetical protein